MENVWPHRTTEQKSQAWIQRQLDKISEALRAMSQGLADKPYCSGAHLSLSDIAVGCAVGYLDFRFSDIDWRGAYPNLDKLYAKLMQRPSFVDSLPK
jgi:glutathione S-transferase